MDLFVLLFGLTTARHPAMPVERVYEIAHDLSTAVELVEPERLPFRGPGARHATAVAIWAMADHEASLRAEVQDCSVCDGKTARCDRGTSITMFQYKRHFWRGLEREHLCGDGLLAAYVGVLGLSNVGGSFQGYAGCWVPGLCAGDEIQSLFERTAKRVGLTSCGGRCWVYRDPHDQPIDQSSTTRVAADAPRPDTAASM